MDVTGNNNAAIPLTAIVIIIMLQPPESISGKGRYVNITLQTTANAAAKNTDLDFLAAGITMAINMPYKAIPRADETLSGSRLVTACLLYTSIMHGRLSYAAEKHN